MGFHLPPFDSKLTPGGYTYLKCSVRSLMNELVRLYRARYTTAVLIPMNATPNIVLECVLCLDTIFLFVMMCLIAHEIVYQVALSWFIIA